MGKNKVLLLMAGDGLYVISALEIVIALFLLTLLTREENNGIDETSEGGS